MAVLTHKITITYTTDSGQVAAGTSTITNNYEQNFVVTATASTSNQEVDWALTLANVKSLLLYSDVAVTLKTNTVGGADTITLNAGIPIVWDTNFSSAIPFTTVVNKIYLTNGTAGDANVKGYALLDQTP